MSEVSVIMVDDEAVAARVFGAAVARAGYETAYARDPEEAIGMIEALRPGLVISDVQMPGVDGFEFVRRLVDKGLKTMPIIYLTGLDDLDVIIEGLDAGADDFLVKGAAIDVINSRVAFWIASGFLGLPDDIRRRALEAANLGKLDGQMDFKQDVVFDERILKSVAATLHKELQTVPQTYGSRKIERLMFLGRLSKLTLDEAQQFGDLLRFPDYVMRTAYMLNRPWARELSVLLKYYDHWAQDVRFVKSAIEPINEIHNYQWFKDGIDLVQMAERL